MRSPATATQRRSRARRARPPRIRLALAGAVAALALAASLASFALASSSTLVSSASSQALGAELAVSTQGHTLYVLTPETAHHLLCVSRECLRLWPPLTVGSSRTRLKASPGVHGRLALVRRSGGILQVTLNGLPLYRYAGDHGRAEDNGQGIEAFGGTWHAMLADGHASGASASDTQSQAPAASEPASAPSQGSTTTAPTTTTTAPTTTTSTPAPAPGSPPSYPGYQY